MRRASLDFPGSGQIWRKMSDDALKGRLALRLEQVGMKRAELARLLGESEKNLQNWITGSTAVPASFLVRYMSVVPVSAEWLLTGQGDPNPPDPSTAERAFEGIRRIVQLADVAPDQLDRVLGSLSDWERFKRGGGGQP